MKNKIKLTATFILLLVGLNLYSQSDKEKAIEIGKEAIKLMDNGEVDESIKLLKDAQKLDPDNFAYPYEIAYALYMKKEYKSAVKTLEKISKYQNLSERYFQLLGNSYDMIGNSEKAFEVYDKGLELFPNSGSFYLEKGNVHWGKKEYGKALPYYEKGIEVAPNYSSNYYRATLIYCNSTEEVWGMIYGEIFMNLERNSKRTSEISQLLYDTYKSEINFTSDTSFSVSFSKSGSINISDLEDPSKVKLPFGIGVYEPILMISMVNESTIDISSLDRIRKNFVSNYLNNKSEDQFPNILFNYQNSVLKAGHLEAYNHWILMKGDEEGFDKWIEQNKTKWEAFIEWFKENGLEIN